LADLAGAADSLADEAARPWLAPEKA
jgi:hypothetical protein